MPRPDPRRGELEPEKGMRHFFLVLASASLLALGCEAGGPDRTVASVSALKAGCKVECPKCKLGRICPMTACQLVCPPGVKPCGNNTCTKGETCCSEECGVCMKTGPLGCPAIKCLPPVTGCATDADCRTFSDYCTGCDCRALLVMDTDPVCSGPGVRCFADPCGGKVATCDVATGQCGLATAP